ncbi:MAG TPA: GntR family transcriptional regulator [Ktedonobacteraceae bacterium]|nr:GntR family transcriptional regulator [Ktedonobacteraceae bacterium]
MIEFHLDDRSGVPPYLQIVQQVKQALRLGLLNVGDQLPTVREVVEQLVINPNTVLKAYRELEREGLVSSRPGQGTFVLRTLGAVSLASQAALRRGLERWLESAHEAGLDDESILALFNTTFWDVRAAESEKSEGTA